MRLLIAEGSSLMRTFLRRWWSGLGIKIVDVVGDAQRAIDVVRRTAPDAVLWDLGTPSVEEFRRVQALKREAHVPLVIVWSAFPSTLCREWYLDAGADYYLDKTTEFEVVADLLRDERVACAL